jgi:hypothetical protein
MKLSNIDFKSGEVVYNDFHMDSTLPLKEQLMYLNEDLMQVQYPKNFVLDIGWYHGMNGRFVVRVIKDQEWDNPILRKETRSFNRLEEFIKFSSLFITNLIENLNQQVTVREIPCNFDRSKFIRLFDEEKVLDREAGSYFYSMALKEGFEFDLHILIADQFVAVRLRHVPSQAMIFDIGLEDINHLDLSESGDLEAVSLDLCKGEKINVPFLKIAIKPVPSLDLTI